MNLLANIPPLQINYEQSAFLCKKPPRFARACVVCVRSFFFLLSAHDAAAQTEKMVRAKGERHIQADHDDDVENLRGHVADRICDALAQRLQGSNVAAIEIVVIGTQQMRDDGSNDTVSANAEYGVFPISLLGSVDVQRNDQHKGEHDQVVEGHGVKIEIVLKIARDVARAVDQAGINGGQQKDRRHKSDRNAVGGALIFAAIERHDGQRKEHE